MSSTLTIANLDPSRANTSIPCFATKVLYKIKQSESDGLVSDLPRIPPASVLKAIEHLKKMYADLEIFEKGIYGGLKSAASQPAQRVNTDRIALFCKRIEGFRVIQNDTNKVMNTIFVNTISTHSTSNLLVTQASAAMETDTRIPPTIVTDVSFEIIQYPDGDNPVGILPKISLESMNNTLEQISKMLGDLEAFEKGFTASRSTSQDYHRRAAGFMHVLAVIDTVYKYIFSSQRNFVTASYINTVPNIKTTPKPTTDSASMAVIHDERLPVPTPDLLNRSQVRSRPKRTQSAPTPSSTKRSKLK